MAETPADPPEPEAASRVIIVAPFGADMAVLKRIVAAHDLRPVTAPGECGPLEERLAAGWDILVLTAEACRPRILSCVAARLLDLPVWSAPPVVMLSETEIAGRKAAGLLREARPDLPVAILIRPCDEVEIASALSVARQSRVGQLRVRDLLEDRERAVEHSGFLYHELSHRVSNLFAMIKALAGQTLRHTPDPGTFLGAFNDRMDALAGIYGAMRADDWETTELDAIVRGAVLPLLADTEAINRFTADGPPVRLVADVVTSLGLALHELGNNSRKHGALSVAQGRVSVTWSRSAGGDGLDMRWQEAGGPEVHPPTREGFGTTVIRSALKGEGASVDLDYRAEGVVCRFRIPRRFLS